MRRYIQILVLVAAIRVSKGDDSLTEYENSEPTLNQNWPADDNSFGGTDEPFERATWLQSDEHQVLDNDNGKSKPLEPEDRQISGYSRAGQEPTLPQTHEPPSSLWSSATSYLSAASYFTGTKAAFFALARARTWLYNQWLFANPSCQGYNVGWICVWSVYGDFYASADCIESLNYRGLTPWLQDDNKSMCFVLFNGDSSRYATVSVGGSLEAAKKKRCVVDTCLSHKIDCSAVKG